MRQAPTLCANPSQMVITRTCNGNGAQILAHASLADVPVSNLKDLDLNQGDTIGPSSLCLCMTYNVFGVTLFA